MMSTNEQANKSFVATGKRKVAKARATVKKGSGIVRINKINIDAIGRKYFKMAIETPLVIAGDIRNTVDINVSVNGGGVTGQKDAIKQAIARALVKWTNSEELKKKFIAFDRNLIVFDSRKNETSKFSRSSAGPRRKRQSSKR